MADQVPAATLYKTAAGVLPAGSGSPIKVLPADPGRIVLMLASSTNGGGQGAYLGPPNPSGFHFFVGGLVPIVLTYQMIGDLIFGELWIDGQFPQGIQSWATLSKV